jgi:hypothetical protein
MTSPKSPIDITFTYCNDKAKTKLKKYFSNFNAQYIYTVHTVTI